MQLPVGIGQRPSVRTRVVQGREHLSRQGLGKFVVQGEMRHQQPVVNGAKEDITHQIGVEMRIEFTRGLAVFDEVARHHAAPQQKSFPEGGQDPGIGLAFGNEFGYDAAVPATILLDQVAYLGAERRSRRYKYFVNIWGSVVISDFAQNRH